MMTEVEYIAVLKLYGTVEVYRESYAFIARLENDIGSQCSGMGATRTEAIHDLFHRFRALVYDNVNTDMD